MTGNTDAQGGLDAPGAAVPAADATAVAGTTAATAAAAIRATTVTTAAKATAVATATAGTTSTAATDRLAALGGAAEIEPDRRAAFDEPGGPPPLKDWPGLDDGPAARPEVPSVPGLPGVPQVPSEVLAGSSALIPRMGQPGRYKWAFSAIWLVYLVGPLVQAVQADKPMAWKVATFVLIGLFSALYVALCIWSFQRKTPQSRVPAALPAVLALVVIAAAGCLFVSPHLIGLWVYIGSAAGLSLPLVPRLAQRMVIVAVVGVTLSSWLGHLSASDWFSVALPTFFAGLACIGIRQMSSLIAELREAREQVARLAANEERLRMARDLHDLTGHSLSMITLKAQLAQRMLARAPRTREIETALKEVGEIEEASRQSLTDIRETVSGYRRATLAVELSSAAAALGAAGIALDAEPGVREASGRYEPEAEAALAWCLREGVTNVIRHSGATRVRMRLLERGGELVLTVQNDGRGLSTAAKGPGTVGGNGLAGLRERLDAVDGRITVGGCDGDFRMVAAVPVSTARKV